MHGIGHALSDGMHNSSFLTWAAVMGLLISACPRAHAEIDTLDAEQSGYMGIEFIENEAKPPLQVGFVEKVVDAKSKSVALLNIDDSETNDKFRSLMENPENQKLKNMSKGVTDVLVAQKSNFRAIFGKLAAASSTGKSASDYVIHVKVKYNPSHSAKRTLGYLYIDLLEKQPGGTFRQIATSGGPLPSIWHDDVTRRTSVAIESLLSEAETFMSKSKSALVLPSPDQSSAIAEGHLKVLPLDEAPAALPAAVADEHSPMAI